MKNFRVLSMTALVVFSMLTACSKDDDGPASDCFDCVAGGVTTKYCYVAGSEFYTVTFGGQSIEVDLQEGETWEETKVGLQSLCDE